MLEDLTEDTLAPGFWNAPDKAQSTLRKRAQVEAKLELAETLGRQIEDLAEYLELAAAENDDGAAADAAKQADELAKRVRKAEPDREVAGRADQADDMGR